jgi:hypothetical protein
MTPEEIADLCKAHEPALVDEVSRLETHLKESENASFYYKYQDQARTCRELLSRNSV